MSCAVALSVLMPQVNRDVMAKRRGTIRPNYNTTETFKNYTACFLKSGLLEITSSVNKSHIFVTIYTTF